MMSLMPITLVIGLAAAQAPIVLSDLTLPGNHLPADCLLPPERFTLVGPIRVDRWLGLPLTSNPWQGTDPGILGVIRDRMLNFVEETHVRPRDLREIADYRLKLAEGLEEGYAAVYHDTVRQRLIPVFAVRFPRGVSPTHLGDKVRGLRMTFGSVDAVMHGDGGPCADAISAHLKSLAN